MLIGWRVLAGDLLDYVRFRAVCSDWKSSTFRPRGRGLLDPRFHPRRWMMLPEGHGLYPSHPNLGGYVRFFNLATGAFVRVHLPLFDGHIVLDSIDGLLLLLRHTDTTAVRLLHPFTGEIAKLPPLLSLLSQIQRRQFGTFLHGICATATVTATGAITVMISLDMTASNCVAYAAAGDQRWTLSAWKLPSLATQRIFFEGKLYLTSNTSKNHQDDDKLYIYRVDPPQPDVEPGSLSLPPPVLIAKCPVVHEDYISTHLVECGSELMVLNFSVSPVTLYPHLVLYRLADLISGRAIPVRNIGERALFIGSRALCVSTNKGHPCFLANTITCINRYAEPKSQVDHCHLDSGTWSPAMDGDILCHDRTPASPYMLTHHIFTCCLHCYWNKGLIVCAAVTPNWSVKPNLCIQG